MESPPQEAIITFPISSVFLSQTLIAFVSIESFLSERPFLHLSDWSSRKKEDDEALYQSIKDGSRLMFWEIKTHKHVDVWPKWRASEKRQDLVDLFYDQRHVLELANYNVTAKCERAFVQVPERLNKD